MTATLNLPSRSKVEPEAHASGDLDGSTSSSDHSRADAHGNSVAAGLNFPSASVLASTHTSSAEGAQLTDDHHGSESQTACVVGVQLAESTVSSDTHMWDDSAPNFDSNQSRIDPHPTNAAVEPTFPAAIAVAHAQSRPAAGDSTSTPGHATGDNQPPSARGGFLRDPVLGVLADVLNDLEAVRVANANRVRILTRNEADGDGEERGHGLTEDHPQVKALALTVKALEVAEHEAVLNLQRSMRKHPLAAFQKRHKGIGEKQLARLLATIGDPYWNDLHQRPRTVSELWAYAGFHVLRAGGHGVHDSPGSTAPGVAPKRTRGQKSNWSEDARKRTWVIASAMPKFAGGHYETVYRDARVKYAESVHPSVCVRCGPKNKPAEVGSPLSDGHKHARAIRITAKEILKDLWIEAKSIHELPESKPVTIPSGDSIRDLNPDPVATAAKRATGSATNGGAS